MFKRKKIIKIVFIVLLYMYIIYSFFSFYKMIDLSTKIYKPKYKIGVDTYDKVFNSLEFDKVELYFEWDSVETIKLVDGKTTYIFVNDTLRQIINI